MKPKIQYKPMDDKNINTEEIICFPCKECTQRDSYCDKHPCEYVSGLQSASDYYEATVIPARIAEAELKVNQSITEIL